MSGVGRKRAVQVVTDSAADIPERLLRDRPITVVPLTVDIGGRSYLDGIDLGPEELLAALRRGELPRTSQPSIGAFRDTYTDLIEQDCDVVSVHVASRLSGTFNASRSAAEMVAPERIRLVDSRTVSMGVGWLALEAAERARDGRSLDEVVEHTRQRIAGQRVYATVETLEFLQRGGRIGRSAALLGSALQIRPVLEVRDGGVEPLERVRTSRRALDRLVALVEEQMPIDRAAVLHFAAEESATVLAARLEAAQPGLSVVVDRIGTVIATYGGPGTVGIAALLRRE